MIFRLIALDVDGTLLNDDHMLTERTKHAVRSAAEAGAVIVLCTGRGPDNSLPVMRELGIDGHLIGHNGAVTVRTSDLSVGHQYPFEPRQVEPVVRYCRERGIHYDLCTPFRLYIDRELEEPVRQMYRDYMIEPETTEDVLRLTELPVKMTMFADPATLDRLEDDWRGTEFPLRFIRSDARFIDVMHPEANKGNALRRLAESMGIGREQILAVGNYYNDLEMIRFAGIGVAMGNAPEIVKRAADIVAPANNEDGVSWALLRYGLHIRQSF